MRPAHCIPRAVVAIFLVLAALSGCAAAQPVATLQPFSTDGCSRFPDRAPSGHADWCQCCVVHDLAYWRGGTSEERLGADLALKACVRNASGSELLAEVMFAGVRAGGGPHLPTSYRWGYGWPAGRPYRQLTLGEEALAANFAREYLAANPALSCPKDTQ